ncbi:hypothetical protein DFQ28_000316 [Apophysomyces sp. BC1034]|nr:hypothetical protein DFQ28_000316 [Apophysomyces sp. BC1034]
MSPATSFSTFESNRLFAITFSPSSSGVQPLFDEEDNQLSQLESSTAPGLSLPSSLLPPHPSLPPLPRYNRASLRERALRHTPRIPRLRRQDASFRTESQLEPEENGRHDQLIREPLHIGHNCITEEAVDLSSLCRRNTSNRTKSDYTLLDFEVVMEDGGQYRQVHTHPTNDP